MSPEEIIRKGMFANDAFSQWMGIEIIETSLGFCKLSMKVRDEMLNGFKILHGGVTYAFADSAFAFASNSYGTHAVSIETSISHTRMVRSGEVLYAEASTKSRGKKTGIYEVVVTNQDEKTVALFKGTVFHLDKEWAL